MNTIERIQQGIENLSPEDYAQLRKWFAERDWREWDDQIASDSEAGKLNFLLEEAADEKKAKKLSEL
jgi:hypothetical protein